MDRYLVSTIEERWRRQVAWQARLARPSLSVPQAGRPVLVSKSSRERLWFGLVPSCLFRQRGPRGRFRGPANAGEKKRRADWVGGRLLRRAEQSTLIGWPTARPSKQTTSTPRASGLEANRRRDRWHGIESRHGRRSGACAPVPVAVNPGGTLNKD